MTTRIWSKKELTIAFYIAKFGHVGLSASESEIAHGVIGNTTIVSLHMQIKHFKSILGIPGYTLNVEARRLMQEVVSDHKDTTSSNLRKYVNQVIEERRENIIKAERENINKKASGNAAKINKQEEINFKAKLDLYKRMGRRLSPLNKSKK